MRQKHDSSGSTYGILGLGRFGLPLAEALAAAGKEVIAADQDEGRVKMASAFTDNAFVVKKFTRENLREIGIQNCDVVIIGIGEKIDVSILTTLTVLQLEVPRVIAKASSSEQGSVLSVLGAEVVYPERDMALRLSKRLLAPRVLEYIALSDDTDISEIRLSGPECGKTVAELQIRRRFGLNIIAIRRGEALDTTISPDDFLAEGDVIIVIGKTEAIHRFESCL